MYFLDISDKITQKPFIFLRFFSKYVVIQVCSADVLTVEVARHLLSPVVPRHGGVLLPISLRIARDFSELLGETLLVLILLHILEISLDLRLELVERIQLGFVLSRALLSAEGVLSVTLLKVDLQIPEIVLQPVG